MEWDLTGAALEDGVTYTVSFTVWPSQTAYDLVADLNNGIRTWSSLTADEKKQVLENPEGSGNYELRTNPPSADGYNEITYEEVLTEILDERPDDVELDTPITDGNVTTVYTDNGDGTYTKTVTTEKETAFNDPDKNMSLQDTISKVMKKWISDLQLRQLVEYLYDTENNQSKEIKIPFVLNKGENIYGNTIWLGWNQEGTDTGYTWSDMTQEVPVGDNTYTVGTEWTKRFDIAVGLLLDYDFAVERGIDLTDTDKYQEIDYNGITLYMLEPGHDYYINEPAVAALLGYRFDFSTRIYHPMLLNGTLKSVTIENGVVTEVYPDGTLALSALVGENTLRGGINLHKILWDKNGNPIPDSETVDDEFKFTIELTNTSVIEEKTLASDGVTWIESEHNVFVGDDIPWYSVNGMYYHDDEGNYYSEDGTGRSGNIMLDSENGQKATIELSIKRTDTIRIANVPAGTEFTITETPRDDYDFVKASRGVTGTTYYDRTVTVPSIGGEIVPNKEMNVAFTNKIADKFNVNILKKNSADNAALPGAVFSLYGNDYYVKDGQGQPTSTINEEAVPIRQNLTSDENGILSLGELVSGVYYLVETHAPAGFLSTTPITIIVDKDSTKTKIVDGEPLPLYVTYHQDDYAGSDDNIGTIIAVSSEETTDGTIITYSYTLTAMNNPGVVLPSTGGPGTLLFYLTGIILTCVAGTILVMRNRRRTI